MFRFAVMFLAFAIAFLNTQSASAQVIDVGLRVQGAATLIDFAEDYDFIGPAKLCLNYCVETIVTRNEFTCAPFFIPPDTRCDLPWFEGSQGIDPFLPVPLPWADPEGCIPSEPEVGGYRLSETHQSIRQLYHHRSDCSSDATETVLARLPRTNNPPRTCPDAGGPWVDSQTTVTSVRFAPCP